MSQPDTALSRTIADATRRAIDDLRKRHPENFYVFALLTTGEAFAPYLSACSVEADRHAGLDRWDLASTPYAIWGYDEHFGDVKAAFEARGYLSDMDDSAADADADADADAEYDVRLASIEQAWRLLDADDVFGTGADREQLLLLVATMPPDESDVGYARRLNPDTPLLREWLAEAAEGV